MDPDGNTLRKLGVLGALGGSIRASGRDVSRLAGAATGRLGCWFVAGQKDGRFGPCSENPVCFYFYEGQIFTHAHPIRLSRELRFDPPDFLLPVSGAFLITLHRQQPLCRYRAMVGGASSQHSSLWVVVKHPGAARRCEDERPFDSSDSLRASPEQPEILRFAQNDRKRRGGTSRLFAVGSERSETGQGRSQKPEARG